MTERIETQRERAAIERFADHWSAAGESRLEGLIAGYLLLDETGEVSAAELAEKLGISSGSVSTYTRQLIDRGFVHRVRKPGVRAHFFTMGNDVWAGFLAAEQEYLQNQFRLAEEAMSLVSEGGRSWERLRNMRDYMGWMIDAKLPAGWEQFKRKRDVGAP